MGEDSDIKLTMAHISIPPAQLGIFGILHVRVFVRNVCDFKIFKVYLRFFKQNAYIFVHNSVNLEDIFDSFLARNDQNYERREKH